MAQIRLVLAVEAEFGVRFEMEEVSGMRSVGEFLEKAEGKRQKAEGKRGNTGNGKTEKRKDGRTRTFNAQHSTLNVQRGARRGRVTPGRHGR